MSEPCLYYVYAPVICSSFHPAEHPCLSPLVDPCWPCRCDCFDLTPSSSELQRMSQRHGPHQGACVGRGRWHQIASEAAFQTRIRRLPGPDHHRGPHTQRGNGCLVQSRYSPVVVLKCSHHGFDSVYLMWMNIDFSVVNLSYISSNSSQIQDIN